jgi:hypothetical protein
VAHLNRWASSACAQGFAKYPYASVRIIGGLALILELDEDQGQRKRRLPICTVRTERQLVRDLAAAKVHGRFE